MPLSPATNSSPMKSSRRIEVNHTLHFDNLQMIEKP
jgi:hypothetical protein